MAFIKELLKAVIDNNKADFEKYLIACPDVDERLGDNQTVLMLAAGLYRAEMVSSLIKEGADVNAKDSFGKFPLMYASAIVIIEQYGIDSLEGQAETVDILLKAGADVNMRDRNGYTALMYPCQYGHYDLVKTLLAAGADSSFHTKDGWSAGGFAARNGYDNILDLFHCAEPTKKEGKFTSAESGVCEVLGLIKNAEYEEAKKTADKILKQFPNAAESYYLYALVRYDDLPDKKENIDLKNHLDKAIELKPNYQEAYALRGLINSFLKDRSAAIKDYEKALELNPNDIKTLCDLSCEKKLLGDYAGALETAQKAYFMNTCDKEAFDNLDYIQEEFLKTVPKGTPFLEITLKNGKRAFKVIKDAVPYTLIMLDNKKAEVSDESHLKNMKILSRKDINKELLWACHTHDMELMALLLNFGAAINYKFMRETPLINAASGNNSHKSLTAVKLLLKLGAGVDFKNSLGETPLISLLKKSVVSVMVLKELINAGADLNAKDKNGKTARELIKENPHFYKELKDLL